ncbi:dihydrofolate reductase family protein [Arthrobacter sp. Sa2BUA2]|uniref:Dihydrofolate reductase family protein n=1 Tax=Arthrobacter pullicola TaxID=2762224 RepID=A0ABR8YE63_9MICC|nr:dihydrofolate reductase family protein [Arthrobacter pullicola]MBD8042499.1 dihydrofolate reductase family protein [Arthrobacter pullicola]
MGKVLIHATVTVDGFMADSDGGVDWMFDAESVEADTALVNRVVREIGAVVGGANKTQTIEPGEEPYGGMLKVPVFLMTHSPRGPIEKDGITYAFLDDLPQAVERARTAAGARAVALLGGSISRQCLELGIVDEIQLHVVPILLGRGISLFSGLERPVNLERLETEAFAGGIHLRFRVLQPG